MKLLPATLLLLAISATVPAICQSSNSQISSSASSTKPNLVSAGGATASGGVTAPSKPAEASTPPVNPTVLRTDIAHQDKVIQNQIDAQQNLLKKNKELMKEAKTLEERNKKLAQQNQKLEAKNRAFNAEKKNVEAQNTDLAKKHEAIKAAEKPIATPVN